MTFLSKVFKSKDGSASSIKSSSQAVREGVSSAPAPRPQWQDAWARTSVAADEVQILLHVCTQQMKSRALDMPFLLLPFRPNSDPTAAKYFIRSFFNDVSNRGGQPDVSRLHQEIKLIEPMVLCSIMKWCWSRLKGGVVTWNTYELFKTGEKESNMDKRAFNNLIPLSVASDARKKIIFDFFDLLAAIAANGKANGLGGRKLSRLAGWWAFELSDNGRGFDGGYKSWSRAADATSHLFFAYLRSLGPESPTTGGSGYSQLPRSLQALVAQTEYPPEKPSLLQSTTPKVLMIVDSVSPTPFALLRRAKHFEYRDDHRALQRFSAYNDPLLALTPECRRVLQCVSSTNQSAGADLTLLPSLPHETEWSRFEDIGFTGVLDDSGDRERKSQTSFPRSSVSDPPHPADIRRPSTPSWADFLSSGFSDENAENGPPSLILPPDQVLPPINASRVHSSQSHLRNGMKDDDLMPGELASINQLDLDETFWWVWMTSLASEEPPERKAVFGRCAFIETEIEGTRWLIVEEQVKGATVQPDIGGTIVEKNRRFFSTRKTRSRRQSLGKKSALPPIPKLDDKSRSMHNLSTVGADQQAKVHAAAAAMLQKQKIDEESQNDDLVGRRRARTDEDSQAKTTSVLTLQPVILKEAAPAIQWARKFDKEAIRAKYLGDLDAGKGEHIQLTPSASSVQLASQVESKPVPPEKDVIKSSELPPAPAPEARDMALGTTEPAPNPVQDSIPLRPPPPVPKDDEKPQPEMNFLPTPTRSTEPAVTVPEVASTSTTAPPVPLPEPSSGAYSTPAVEAMVPGAHVGTSAEHSRGLPDEKIELAQPVVTSPPEPASSQIHRRPVGGNSVDSMTRHHPALRNNAPVESQTVHKEPVTTNAATSAPAATAAAAAAGITPWRSDNAASWTTSDRAAAPSMSKKGSTRGFRKLFGKKKGETPEAIAAQRAVNGSAHPEPANKTVERKSSLLRKKGAAIPPARTPPSVPYSETKEAVTAKSSVPETPEPETVDLVEGEPGPIMSTQIEESFDEPQHSPVMTDPTYPNKSDAQFSNFSQGVSEDDYEHDDGGDVTPRPGHALDREQEPDVSDIVHQNEYQTRAAPLLDPRVDSEETASHPTPLTETDYETPMESISGTNHDLSEDESSNQSFTLTNPPAVQTASTATTADRWAQIKQNAAERRGADESGSRQSQSARTDEGDTSGEETIESRVARIKARVAELTGNATPPSKA